MKRISAKIIVLTALSLAACSPIVATRGNLISQTKFEQIQANKSTRADIVRIWGPPTTTSTFNSNIWYYIGETTAQKGVFAPEVQTRRMIRVQFDTANNDTIVSVEDLDPANAKNIEFVGRTTPSAGKEFTAFQQFVGNLGKYNSNAAEKK